MLPNRTKYANAVTSLLTARTERQALPSRHQPGFSLVELLVVIAVIATLLALLLPSLGRARAAAQMTVEQSAGRQLMVAHALYAGEHSGWLLPGFPSQTMVRRGDVIARNDRGERLNGLLAQRYPWRLLPYGEFDLGLVYTDRRVLHNLGASVDLDYRVSLAPRLGLNQAFVGGSADKDGTGIALHDSPTIRGTALQRWGDGWYARRNSDPARPTELIVFASSDRLVTESGGLLSGYYSVTPPHFGRRLWPTKPPRAGEVPNGWGAVSMRFSSRAVAAMFDGHCALLGWDELQDMRRWAPRATTPEYAPIKR